MKLITAIIRPEKLTDLKAALSEAGVDRMTVSNCIGCGQQKGYTQEYRGNIHEVKLLKKVRVEIAVNDSYLEKAIEAVIRGSRTGEIGDGKIFVTDLVDCIRIRTGERGVIAVGGESREADEAKKKKK